MGYTKASLVKYSFSFAYRGQNNCRVCEGHCSHTTHYHARKTMQTTDQSLDEVLHDMKAKFDAASKGKNDQMQQITSIKTAKAGVMKVHPSHTQLLD